MIIFKYIYFKIKIFENYFKKNIYLKFTKIYMNLLYKIANFVNFRKKHNNFIDNHLLKIRGWKKWKYIFLILINLKLVLSIATNIR